MKNQKVTGKLTMTAMKIADIKILKNNPRRIEPCNLNRLGKSIDNFGYVQPLIWNRQTGNLVSGHQRLKLLKERGITTVDVVAVDIPADRERVLALVMNSNGVTGTFTDDVDDWIKEIKKGFPELEDLLAGMKDIQPDNPEVELRRLEIREPPKMTWALIGIPTVRFGEISELVERIAKVQSVICEVVANNGD